MRYIVAIVTLFLFPALGEADNLQSDSVLDSLNQNLKRAPNDSVKANSLLDIGEYFYRRGRYDEAILKYNECLSLSQKSKNKYNISASYNGLGSTYEALGNYSEAIKMLFASLKISEETGDKYAVVSIYINTSLIYCDIKNYTEALKTANEAFKISESLKDKVYLGYVYNTFGIIYYYQQNFPLALESHSKALKIRQAIGDKSSLSDSYGNLGIVFYDLGLEAQKNNNKDSANACFERARESYATGKKLAEEIQSIAGVAGSDLNMGSLYTQLHKYAEANKTLQNALKLYEEIGSLEGIKECYNALAEVTEKSGKAGKSLEYYKMYIVYRDSLVNEMNIKKTIQTQMQYEFDKKEASVKLDQEKKDAIAAAEKRKQKIVLFSISGFGILVLLLAGVIFRSLRMNQKKNAIIQAQKELVEHQKEIVEEKQKEILDSIYYARRIQRSLLPNEKYFKKFFK